MQPGQMAYDRGTVFSPDGRLFQVEYAREAVKKGTTTIGLKYKDGVILMVDKRVSSKLVEPKSIEKIYMIDEFIGCASSGLVADARILVDGARRFAQEHKLTYNENITVEGLVKKICDYKQNCTMYGGARPLGTALLVAGTDDTGIQLFETDPSGALVAYKATCIGSERPTVMDLLEKEFKEDMTFDEAMALGLKALAAALEEKPTSSGVEVALVTVDKPFRKLKTEELETFISKLE